MENFERYALYYAPEPGDFADFAAAWLGWDPVTGRAVPHPQIAGLPAPIDQLTATPRKYGFHGTIKPPFRLAQGATVGDLTAACATLAARLAPVSAPGLDLVQLGGFLALVPRGAGTDLAQLAASVVRDLDPFRAPPTPEEIARRRPERLSPRQRELLARWGYPHVMEEFRFHLTLTGDVDPDIAAATRQSLGPLLEPLLPRPFVIGRLCLFGEQQDGRFRLLHRYALSG